MALVLAQKIVDIAVISVTELFAKCIEDHILTLRKFLLHLHMG